jgi:hypothetical protein
MTEQGKPEPGTRARLIREALERHPGRTPEELVEILTREHGDLGVEFTAGDVRKVKEFLRDPVQTNAADELPGYRPLFTDRIPPLREHENPQLLQDLPPSPGDHPDQRQGS